MVDKLNITIEDKNTKAIEYMLSLDDGTWDKSEYNDEGREICYESSLSYWYERAWVITR